MEAGSKWDKESQKNNWNFIRHRKAYSNRTCNPEGMQDTALLTVAAATLETVKH